MLLLAWGWGMGGGALAQPISTAQWKVDVSLVAGIPRNCGMPPFSSRLIEVTGTKLVGKRLNDGNGSGGDTYLNLDGLQPDGSGRVITKGSPGWIFDFDPGHGARVIRVRRLDSECVYLWQPRS